MEHFWEVYIRHEFFSYCEALNRMDIHSQFVADLTASSPTNNSSTTETVLCGLISRIMFAKDAERKLFIEQHFSLPIGPRLKLIQIIENAASLPQNQQCLYELDRQIEDITERKIRISRFETVIQHSLLERPWSDWKQGHISLPELFAKLNYFMHERMLDLKSYQLIVDLILYYEGYNTQDRFPNSPVNLEAPTSVVLPSLPFESIWNIYSSKSANESVTIVTLDHKIVRLSSDGKASFYKISAFPSVSNANLWWRYGGNLDYFAFEHCEDDSFDERISVLVISPHLRLDRGILEIDQIQSVDSIPREKSNTIFALIIYGRWKCSLEMSQQFLHEGVTDHGGADDFDNSPNGSGNEGSQQIVPDYSYPNQFFLIYGEVINGLCVIHSISSLQGFSFPDQIPNHIQLFSSRFGVVFGSNALLALFLVDDTKGARLEGYWSTTSYRDGEDVDFSSSIKFQMLPDDSLLVQEEEETLFSPQISHYGDAAIVSVDCSLEMHLLVSLDNTGTLCLWKFNPKTLLSCLVGLPYYFSCSSSTAGRVLRVQFTPSGDHLVLQALDRALLMKITSDAIGPTSSWMYERCSLDLSQFHLCRYHVVFATEKILVWKIAESESPDPAENSLVPSGVVVSRWAHTNVDSFLFNQSLFLNTSFSISRRYTNALGALPPRKEAGSETDQAALLTLDDTLPPRSYLSCDDDIHEIEENLNFLDYNGEYVPIYKDCCIDFSHLCLPLLARETVRREDLFSPRWVSQEVDRLDQTLEVWQRFMKKVRTCFQHDQHPSFLHLKAFLAVLGACFSPPSPLLIAATLDCTIPEVEKIVRKDLKDFLLIQGEGHGSISLRSEWKGFLKWLVGTHPFRVGGEFWIDVSLGHNLLCALYLKHCGNKSVAVEHSWQGYLQTYGSSHLRRSSRGLRLLTTQIRKIDETANIRHYLPHQIGYISGLQEIYARRVGLSGKIPKEIGELQFLRVLSMGNNRLTGELPACLSKLKNLQRIVLHQNNLIGQVPGSLGSLGCIVNLAGNPRLEHGADVPWIERSALIDIFHCTNGNHWNTKTNWNSEEPICKWYKVGVLSSHVHSLVMSSNAMNGYIPASIQNLQQLRMIELATMPELRGPLPPELCCITSLRRLCICRCGLTGSIPKEIGLLTGLEELQLFGNRFTGTVPASLGNLVHLKLLSLGEYTGGNDFAPSPLPECVSRLKNLEALFLANCNLTGPIPRWIGELRELRQLDLQRNKLTGSLPSSIGKLENLLYLNVKDNHTLGGRLPLMELLSLSKLNRLSLVHCSFQDPELVVEAMKVSLPRCKIWI